MKLIGMTGSGHVQAGVGKDTAAAAIADEYGLAQIALADPMKRFVRQVFGFTEEQLWGPSEERNRVDERYTEIGKPWEDAKHRFDQFAPSWVEALHLGEAALFDLGVWFDAVRAERAATPRRILQTVGTEWGRAQGENVWVNYMVRIAEQLCAEPGMIYSRGSGVSYNPTREGQRVLCGGVVVSDVRFNNEAEAITRAGGFVIRIERPGVGLKGAAGTHASEVGVDPALCRGFVPNIGTIDQLENLARAVAGMLMGEHARAAAFMEKVQHTDVAVARP